MVYTNYNWPGALILIFATLLLVNSCDDPSVAAEGSDEPTVSTNEITSVTSESAVSGGTVTDDGGDPVTVRGVCWSITPNPTVDNECSTDGSGTGTFTSTLTDLDSQTEYYVAAYATNRVGTAYGEQKEFISDSICPESVTDTDGNTYGVIQIDEQCWTVENLKTTSYRDGSSIPTNLTNQQWANTTSGAYAIYPHSGGVTEDDVEGIHSDQEMAEAYGLLYNWYAVQDSRGLCPAGWSVPRHRDWTRLTDFIGGTNPRNGNRLKSCRQVNSPLGEGCTTNNHPRWNHDSSQHGTDEFGFAALPGGIRMHSGSFYGIGYPGAWWSSTEGESGGAWSRMIMNKVDDEGGIDEFNGMKALGFSVRCLQN